MQKSPGYFQEAHSAEDTLDKVAADDLRQATKVLSMLGFFLADADHLPAVHFGRAETAEALIKGKQKPVLDVFGMWPKAFDALGPHHN